MLALEWVLFKIKILLKLKYFVTRVTTEIANKIKVITEFSKSLKLSPGFIR